jgi:hypothetical protein
MLIHFNAMNIMLNSQKQLLIKLRNIIFYYKIINISVK